MVKSIFITILLIVVTSTPLIAFSNGGDQRVLGNEYLINLARAPFTPIAGTKTAMTISLVDLKTGNPIQDEMLVNVRVSKGRGSTNFIHEEERISVNSGVFDWSYTFEKPGLHELFIEFAFASNPEVVFKPPDFLLDIQSDKTSNKTDVGWSYLIEGLLLGLVIGWFVARKRKI